MPTEPSLNFVYQTLPTRVVFGRGAVERLADEVAGLGAERALVLCTPGRRAWADEIAAALGPRAAGVHDGAVMHVPIEVAEAARAEALRLGADCTVSIGGCPSSPCRPPIRARR